VIEPVAEDDPYALLGAGKGEGEAAIKKAYRSILGKYHPDRVQHLGEEFRRMAAEKTIAINRAYERIKKERGFT
jgi:DnaJ like chaperone protein